MENHKTVVTQNLIDNDSDWDAHQIELVAFTENCFLHTYMDFVRLLYDCYVPSIMNVHK